MVNLVNVLVQDTGVECLVCYIRTVRTRYSGKGKDGDIPRKWKKSSKKKKKKI